MTPSFPPGLDAWRAEIGRMAKATGRPVSKLRNLGTARTLQRYVKEGDKSVPDLETMCQLSDAVGMDRYTAFGLLGLLPPASSSLVEEIGTLREQVARQYAQITDLRTTDAVAAVVAAAVNTGKWAVACYARPEGPKEYEVFPTNFWLTFSPINDESDLTPDMLNERLLSDDGVARALRASGAIDSTDRGQHLFPTNDKAAKTIWVVDHATRQRFPPTLRASNDRGSGLASAIVIGTTSHTWYDNVSAFLADLLGFGMTLDRLVATQLFGANASNATDLSQAFQQYVERRTRHGYVIGTRIGRQGHDQSEFVPQHPAFELIERSEDTTSLFVILDPTDELLEEENASSAIPWRDLVRQTVLDSAAPSVLIRLGPLATTPPESVQDRRNRCIERSMLSASIAVSVSELLGGRLDPHLSKDNPMRAYHADHRITVQRLLEGGNQKRKGILSVSVRNLPKGPTK
jgi:hypothetical protein